MIFFVVCQAQHSLNNIHCNMWTLCELCPMDCPYPSEPVSSILAATSCLLLPSIPLSSFVKPSPYFPLLSALRAFCAFQRAPLWAVYGQISCLGGSGTCFAVFIFICTSVLHSIWEDPCPIHLLLYHRVDLSVRGYWVSVHDKRALLLHWSKVIMLVNRKLRCKSIKREQIQYK